MLVVLSPPRASVIGFGSDRGCGEKIKGSVKETVGKATGDAKLEAEGKADKVEGKVQNAIGGLKDALRK